jgi:hypothetical protein
MWVVIVKDFYNDCGIGRFEEAVGPFETSQEAEEKAKKINDLRHYAILAEAVEIESKFWGEKD